MKILNFISMKKNKTVKFFVILVSVLTLSFGAFWIFSLLAPDVVSVSSIFGGEGVKKELETKYYAYLDSLETLDFNIRSEKDSKIILIHRERQKHYRTKLEDIRNKLDGTEDTGQQESEPTVDTISSTILTALAIPIGILIVLICVVIYLIRKKKPEPTLPFESSPSLTKRFDDAIAQANAKRPESISAMLESLSQSFEQKKEMLQSVAPDQPRGILKERKEKPMVIAESNSISNTAEIETTALSSAIQQKETDSGKIEIIAPATPIVPHIDDEITEESFEKEAQVNTDVIKLARRGYTSSEIARRLRISQDQVDLIIRMQREG